MKNLYITICLILLASTSFAQTKVPDFKSNASATDNPFPAIKDYDLILACRSYDNAGHELVFSVLVLKNSHWQKLIYKQPAQSVPLSIGQPALTPVATTDAQCDSAYRKLVAAKIFTIDDDSNLPKCNETRTSTDGKNQIVSHVIDDGPESRIWLITPTKIRVLYYYAPEYFANYCLTNKDRQDVVKIVGLFRQLSN